MAVPFNFEPLSTAFALGILIHGLIFQNIELDIYIPHLLVISICAIAGLSYAHISLTNLSVSGAISRTVTEGTCFIIGLFTSMVVYRLFFHRIRKFRGPIWARVSRFYAVYLAAKNVQYHVELRKLHAQYGDFIRTGKTNTGLHFPKMC